MARKRTGNYGEIGKSSKRRGKMQAIEKLDLLMQKALLKCQSDKLRSVVEALRELLPDVLRTLQSLSVDPEASPAQRIHAAEMILGLHQRVLAASLEDDRTIALAAKAKAIADAARAAKITAKVEEKKQDNEVARVRRRYARALAKGAEKEEATQ